jgi:hypothetical protein
VPGGDDFVCTDHHRLSAAQRRVFVTRSAPMELGAEATPAGL